MDSARGSDLGHHLRIARHPRRQRVRAWRGVHARPLHRTQGSWPVLACAHLPEAAQGRLADCDRRYRAAGVDHQGLRDRQGQRGGVVPQIYEANKAVIEVKRYYDAVVSGGTYVACATSSASTLSTRFSRSATRSTMRCSTMVDTATEPWGVKVEMVEMKDVEIPPQMQRAMAQEAQAYAREARPHHQGRGRVGGGDQAHRGGDSSSPRTRWRSSCVACR